MKYTAHLTMAVVALLVASELCHADDYYAYIERWATGTLTSGEPFDSWRIHVVIPEGDDWRASEAVAWLGSGPTWYYNWDAGFVPGDPELFLSFPDAEFATLITSPRLYPNSMTEGQLITQEVVAHEPTLFWALWADLYVDPSADYVVWQGTVVNPITAAYGTIDFYYTTALELDPQYFTFVIPEPASSLLLVLGACTLLRRRG
jgi:hypothetical protein